MSELGPLDEAIEKFYEAADTYVESQN